MLQTKNWILLLIFVLFIASCANEGGLQMTNSGYEYKIYNTVGGATPEPGNYVYFDMDIMNHKDSVLQSYRDQAIKPSLQIPVDPSTSPKPNPLVDVLRKCSAGDSLGIFLPKDSMPGVPPQFADIPTFEYRISVAEIVTDQVYQERMIAEQAALQEKADLLKSRMPEVEGVVNQYVKDIAANKVDWITIEGDLKYVIIEEGTGEYAVEGKTVSAQYYGCLLDGTLFDSSFRSGRGFPFTVGQSAVITGWHKTFPKLKGGSKALAYIPAEMAYGATGSPPVIEPNTDLLFYLEVEAVK